MRAHLKRMTHHDNFIYLTIALTLLLLSTALAQQFSDISTQRFVQSTTVVTLLLGVWGVKRKNYFRSPATIFPVAIITTSYLGYFLDTHQHDYIHLIIMLLFFILTAYQTAKQVIFSGEIDGNKILGAICLYLLMGLIWALTYTLIQIYFGNAFKGTISDTHWYLIFPDFVYFSFVTLTTLGFGDISPTLPISRFLVYFQAIVGQFYLVIIVASLVGSHMSNRSNHHKESNE